MNIIPFLTTAAVIGASLLVIEGIDLASGGEFYLASIARLAQETRTATETTIAPMLPPPTETQTPPPPEETRSFLPPPGETTQPLPPLGETIQQPLLPPPPERSPAPLEPTRPAPPPPPPERPMVPAEPLRPQPAQRLQPTGEGEHFQNIAVPEEEGERDERQEFMDPREIQQTLRDIKQMRNDIKRNYLKQIKKLGSQSDVGQLNEILADLDRFQNALSNSSADASDLREAVEDFRDAQYWDKLNKIRARLEIPKEIKQITLSIRRLERTVKAKAAKNLGFNLDRVQQTLTEMKQNIETVQNHYNGGNLEEAQEAMREFHEEVNPGEIESTITRVRDVKNTLKRVKDQEIRTEVERVLQEVIDAFNNGEYRDARETLDEYADDMQNLINKYLITTGWGWGRKKINREESFSKIRNLDALIKAKLQGGNNTGEKQPSKPPTPQNKPNTPAE